MNGNKFYELLLACLLSFNHPPTKTPVLKNMIRPIIHKKFGVGITR